MVAPPSPHAMIYLDNAATSFPKPTSVVEAISRFMTRCGGSPGRSGHSLSAEAARHVFSAREGLASLFGVADSSRIVFTGNATHALNLALSGILRQGDRVAVSSMEHNSIMRPVNRLAAIRGIVIERIPARGDGWIDPASVEAALAAAPTRLLAVNHASNVTGTVQEIAAMADLCHRHGAMILVDAAQSAGSLPIDCAGMGIDLLAFTGHKALFGPTGIGGLVVGEGIEVEPLVVGGTGSRSEREEHPDFLPDRLEAGTLNTVGIVGLGAGAAFIRETGLSAIRTHEKTLTARLLDGLATIPGVTVHGPRDADSRTPVVSITVAGLTPSDVGYYLDTAYDIKVRVGLHCAPSAHRTIGTFPDGTVRFAPGWFTTASEIDTTLDAVETIAAKVSR